jgi:hypothetical protein
MTRAQTIAEGEQRGKVKGQAKSQALGHGKPLQTFCRCTIQHHKAPFPTLLNPAPTDDGYPIIGQEGF